jgi:hypothetical protein
MFDPAAISYCFQRGLHLLRHLGQGKDGIVYETLEQSAVKVHARTDSYFQERNVYLRLRKCQVNKVNGFAVPTLFSFDDSLLILEMSIVRPPYILDFASAHLDVPPDFPQDVIDQWHDDIRERFGEKFADVMAILDALSRAGVFLLDIHPHNIKFNDPE